MCQHCKLNHMGLTNQSQPSIQRLGHRGSHIVYRTDTEIKVDPSTELPFFAIEDVFLDRTSVLIGCGMPNVFTAIYRSDDDPKGPGWDKFAAFMFWRQEAMVANTKGRLQAGVILELRNLPDEARDAIRNKMKNLSGKRSASCARLNAKMLHQAGFTFGNGHSLRTFVRPTKFASLLWRHGLKYKEQNIDMRVVVTDGKGIGDHFEGIRKDSVWGREARSVSRMVEKIYAKDQPHVPAPQFPVRESVAIDLDRWSGRLTTVGINKPRWLGVKLAFLVGQQPVYTVRLSQVDQVDELKIPLKPFPGKLDRITKIKKHVMFSRPVIATIRHFRMKTIEQYMNIPARAAVDMLIRSDGPDHDGAVLYNCVVTLTDNGAAEARITGLKNQDARSQQSRWVRIINWILAKHVLLSGYDPNTVYACELWVYINVDRQPVLCINSNSGSYKPGTARGEALASYLEKLFGIQVRFSRMEDDSAQAA
jgi:hypothetical protein